jgi:hypothetical protein
MVHIGLLRGFRVCKRSHEEVQIVLWHHPHRSLTCPRMLILFEGILERRLVGLLLVLGNARSHYSTQFSSIALDVLSLIWRIWWANLVITVLKYVAHQGLMLKLLSSQTVIIRVFLPLIETSIGCVPPLDITLVRRIKWLSVLAMQFSAPTGLNDLFDGGWIVERVVFPFGFLNHRQLMPMLFEMLWLLLSSVRALRCGHF